VTFAVGAFILSTIMAGVTYFTARQSFLNERQTAAQRQAFANASLVNNALRAPGTQVQELLESVDTLPGSRSVLLSQGQWYATSPLTVGENAIPSDERTVVLAGSAATQVFTLGGTPEVVIGVPLPASHAFYFEVFSLDELASTLRSLAIALAAGALFTTVAGAIVGRWAAGRALLPLAGISEAAVSIAGGQLDTRVDTGGDPDLRDLATSFNRMAANLQNRIEREARFTSDVSHELRSPLTTLSASVSVLETHSAELTPRARRALTLLDGDLQRFRRMVDDLLEISRFDAGSAELSLDEVNPAELVRHAVASTVAVDSAGNRRPSDIAVQVAPGVENLRIRIDKRRFERVVTNLVENATLYAGGVTRVVVEQGTASRRGPDALPGDVTEYGAETGPPDGPRTPVLRVAIEDAGPGVPDDEKGHIFDRFYRGRQSGQRGSSDGTGLGLSLVAEHVRLHGGSVHVDDVPGGGASFVVEFPFDPPGPGPIGAS
jgi:signal transduction histidine kinase